MEWTGMDPERLKVHRKVWEGLEDLEGENMSEFFCVFLFLWPSLPSICNVLSRRVSRCNME